MRVADFSFDLPEQAIAQQPATPRDSAKLLDARNERFVDRAVVDLPSILDENDILVFNNTRVLPSRLKGVRDQASVEVTLHKYVGASTWKAFARPARKLSPGDVFKVSDSLSAKVISKNGGEVELCFDVSDENLLTLLSQYGQMPLPPYISRKNGRCSEDDERYQTVYADQIGAVAAPTAGLHFTDQLLSTLKESGIQQEFVTLHVGAGTFLPIKVEDTKDHVMHSEYGLLTAEVATRLNHAKSLGKKIIAVGTTSLRLLESAADENGILHPFAKETDIFITPGYRFKVVDKLITNFHLPESTLLMLVSAFSGVGYIRKVYAHAISNGYRFYSYGDASILQCKKGGGENA
jgi:S-adenosylmethionine:tRNA ribosyltransferase-isomerase